MSLALFVRPMAAHETAMVLAMWKADLRFQDKSDKRSWGNRLRNGEFWALVNHVVDRITLPSAAVYVGCHPDEPETPVCWAAVRENEVLHLYARESVRKDPELAAAMQRAFLEIIESRVGPVSRATYDPFKELQR